MNTTRIGSGRWVLVLALLASAACKSGGAHRSGPIPNPPAPAPIPEPYRIQAGDELEIRFFHTPEQNITLPERPDGVISLPLAYEVTAAGLTPEELRGELVQRYARELESPEIAVIVRTFTGYQVHVGGEVDKPGVIELTGARTVLQAIFEAGGFLPTASLADAQVVRRQDDGGYEIVAVDLELVLNGEDARGNLLLRPFDVVYVPPSGVANMNKWVDQYIRQNIPITFSYRLDPQDL